MEISQDVLAEYCRLDEERLKLQRQIDAISRQQKPIKAALLECVVKRSPTKLVTTIGQFLLKVTQRAGTVAWKTEFVALAGADAAEELQAQAEPIQILSVTAI